MTLTFRHRSAYLETIGRNVVVTNGTITLTNVVVRTSYQLPQAVVDNLNDRSTGNVYSRNAREVAVVTGVGHPDIVIMGGTDAQVEMVAALFSQEVLSGSAVWRDTLMESYAQGHGGPIVVLFDAVGSARSASGSAGDGTVIRIQNNLSGGVTDVQGQLVQVQHIIHEILHDSLGTHPIFSDVNGAIGPIISGVGSARTYSSPTGSLSDLLSFTYRGFSLSTAEGQAGLLASLVNSTDDINDQTVQIVLDVNGLLIDEGFLDERFRDDPTLRNSINRGREVYDQIGAAFGRALAGDAPGAAATDFLARFDGKLKDAFSTAQLGKALQGAAIGSVSSLLTAELTDAIGLDGAAADVFGLVVNDNWPSVSLIA
ncbi:MAG: hypothetical protein V3V19_06140 [Cocleimonas sp.]